MKTIIYSLIFMALSVVGTLSAQTANVIYENFAGFTRTDVTVNNRAKILKTDEVTTLSGWTFCSGARQEAGALKLGQGSTIGYVTTPKLDLSSGTITINIQAAEYVAPTVAGAAPVKVAILIDGVKVGEVSVGQAWRDQNHTDPFNNYSLSGISAQTSTSRVTIEVGNSVNGGTAGNSIILDQVDVLVNGSSVISETLAGFSLGYSYTWNKNWIGSGTTYTNFTPVTSPTDLFPFIIGELSTELDSRTQQIGWKGKAIFEKGGMAVIGWERQYNAASVTYPDSPGYLTTPTISFHSGDVLTYTIGTNVGLVGTPSAPTMQVLLGDVNSTNVISTPTLVSSSTTTAGTTYTYTFSTTVESPITFKLGTTSSTKDEVFLSLVQLSRTVTDIEKNSYSLSVSTQKNQLIINNSGLSQNISIFSLSGELLTSVKVSSGYNKFELNKGFYIIRTVNGNSIKIVIP
jgi:hypothetical protein